MKRFVSRRSSLKRKLFETKYRKDNRIGDYIFSSLNLN